MTGQLWPGNISLKEGRRSRNMIASDVGPINCLTDIDGAVSVNIATGELSFRAHVSHVSQEVNQYAGKVRLECHILTLKSRQRGGE